MCLLLVFDVLSYQIFCVSLAIPNQRLYAINIINYVIRRATTTIFAFVVHVFNSASVTVVLQYS